MKKTIQERRSEFITTVRMHEVMYPKEMIQDFCDYWTEHSARGIKMRFEKEKTWSLKGRLSRWYRNDIKWNKVKQMPVLAQTVSKLEKYG